MRGQRPDSPDSAAAFAVRDCARGRPAIPAALEAAEAGATRAATAAESPHSSGATTAYCSRGPRTLSSSWRRWRLRVRG